MPFGVLTGDTLFIGDVGRPDLLASIGVTADELASCLYDSLRNGLMTLPDETQGLPRPRRRLRLREVTVDRDRLDHRGAEGHELRPRGHDPEQFVGVVTEGQPAAPGYFVHDAVLNRKDRDILSEGEPPNPLDLERFTELRDSEASRHRHPGPQGVRGGTPARVGQRRPGRSLRRVRRFGRPAEDRIDAGLRSR
ncbi:MAG: hypothetical protein R2716_08795 [Microthrixaceae bacterium]